MNQFKIQYTWLLLGVLAFLPRTALAQDEVSSCKCPRGRCRFNPS